VKTLSRLLFVVHVISYVIGAFMPIYGICNIWWTWDSSMDILSYRMQKINYNTDFAEVVRNYIYLFAVTTVVLAGLIAMFIFCSGKLVQILKNSKDGSIR
jgi:hypothetical protein